MKKPAALTLSLPVKLILNKIPLTKIKLIKKDNTKMTKTNLTSPEIKKEKAFLTNRT
jgi:hypothetical protein